jgi:uncharacterized protein (TIGR00725 family)
MQITVIGSNKSACSDKLFEAAEMLGKSLAKKNHFVFSGGMGGVMEAVCKGVFETKDRKALTIGILPSLDKSDGNNYLDVIIPSGIGFSRNTILIASADIVIAFGGGAGTLSEIAFAWQYNKTVYCFEGEDGWAKNLSNTNLDDRKQGLLIGFSTIDDLINKLDLHS